MSAPIGAFFWLLVTSVRNAVYLDLRWVAVWG